MKKTFKLLGSVAIMAVIVLSIAACDNGSTSSSTTKFEGRWLNLYASSWGYTDFSVTFSGNNFVWRSVGPENFTANGSFTFTETAITFIPASGQTWKTFTQGYTLSGNVLTLADSFGAFGIGPFTKQ